MTSSRRCRSGHLRHGRLLDRRRAPVFDLVHQIYSHRHDHVCKQNHNKCHQIKSHQFKSNQIESHRIASNQINWNQFDSYRIDISNQIKSNHNRIASQINKYIETLKCRAHLRFTYKENTFIDVVVVWRQNLQLCSTVTIFPPSLAIF